MQPEQSLDATRLCTAEDLLHHRVSPITDNQVGDCGFAQRVEMEEELFVFKTIRLVDPIMLGHQHGDRDAVQREFDRLPATSLTAAALDVVAEAFRRRLAVNTKMS